MPDVVIPNSLYKLKESGQRIPGVIPIVKYIKGVPTVTLQPARNSALHQEGVKAWTPDGGPTQDKLTGAKPVKVPQAMVDRMHANLPAEIRRTAREKFVELAGRLYRDAEQVFKVDGRIKWPESIERELAILGKAKGNEHLVAQVERLAGRMIVKGAREQQAQDSKRSTRPWNGHLSA